MTDRQQEMVRESERKTESESEREIISDRKNGLGEKLKEYLY